MDFSDIFRIVNLAVGVFMVLGGVGQFFPLHTQNVIIAVYLFIFGAATAFLEFQIPPVVAKYASFMFSFLGRGLSLIKMMFLSWPLIIPVEQIVYIFVGCIICGDHWTKYVAGIVVAIVGVAYAVLEYIPSIEPPANMRDADASWGSEQI